jgi:hypothetical protein
MLSLLGRFTKTIFILCLATIVFALYLPSKGVKAANNLEQYAWKYLSKHQILDSNEKLTAYYDLSFMMNSKNAIVITDKRILHHYNQKTSSINIDEINEIYYLSKEDTRHKTIIIKDTNDNVLCLPLYHDQDLFIDFLNSSLKHKFKI